MGERGGAVPQGPGQAGARAATDGMGAGQEGDGSYLVSHLSPLMLVLPPHPPPASRLRCQPPSIAAHRLPARPLPSHRHLPPFHTHTHPAPSFRAPPPSLPLSSHPPPSPAPSTPPPSRPLPPPGPGGPRLQGPAPLPPQPAAVGAVQAARHAPLLQVPPPCLVLSCPPAGPARLPARPPALPECLYYELVHCQARGAVQAGGRRIGVGLQSGFPAGAGAGGGWLSVPSKQVLLLQPHTCSGGGRLQAEGPARQAGRQLLTAQVLQWPREQLRQVGCSCFHASKRSLCAPHLLAGATLASTASSTTPGGCAKW